MGLLSHYLKKRNPLTLKSALDDCLVHDSERGKSFVYKQFYGYLMAVAFRYVKEEMEAEDIVNESFVKIFKKLNTFECAEESQILEKSFKGWIARVTVNTAIDKLRTKKDLLNIDDVSDYEMLTHTVPIATTLEVNDILKLLYELPDIQRTIFNLYEIEGFSHEEIGKELNIPESTSRTYLTRAKSRLRKLYQKEFDINEQIVTGGYR